MRSAFFISFTFFANTLCGQQPGRPIQNGALPAVSPDGKRVAFISNRDGTSDVYVAEVDGGRVTRLTNSPASEGPPRWLADGRVVYSVWANDTARVYATAATGGDAALIATVPQTRGASISPDGKRLLYSAGRMPKSVLTISNIDGTNPRALFSADTSAIVFNAVWSPDGNRIAYARADTLRGPLNVWIADADGSHPKRLTNIPTTEGSPQWPDWSPDGKRLAVQVGKYNRDKPSENTAHIWIVDLNGVATKLAPHDRPFLDETPSWFPDGKRIAIQSDRTGQMEVWIVSIDGKEATQLTK